MKKEFTNTIKTESIKYAGSKLKLLPHILKIIKQSSAETILDGFSGTTRVSQALAQSGYQVLANDISAWSEVLGNCYLLAAAKEKSNYQELIDHLNNTQPYAGWFTENYGGEDINGSAIQKDGLKKPWQKMNTKKLDGIRKEIEKLKLSKIDKAVALTSLMIGLDKIDNSLGHFSSYLNKWPARSYKPLVLTVPKMQKTNKNHKVTRADVFTVAQADVDLCYYDPPYGSGNISMPPSRVRYSAYYHLWTTICQYDKPELFGKAKRRKDSADTVDTSVFEEFRKNSNNEYISVLAVAELIKKTKAKKILLSYAPGDNSINDAVIKNISKYGVINKTLYVDYKKNVMSEMTSSGEWKKTKKGHQEILFYIIKK